MRQLILAIDQGTTGTTVLVVDEDGLVRGRGYVPIPQHYPQPGWVEHDPLDLWRSVPEAAAQALTAAGAAGRDLAAIGITNQRETALLWERATGRPVHRAIVWQCRRTAARCEALRAEGAEAEVRARTGLVLDPYFSGTKLEWLLDADPDRRQQAERGDLAFGTVDSWLVWQLSGGAAHVTDASNASRTLLLNLERAAWDEAMLDLLHVPAAVLPRVVPSSGPVAETVAADPFPAGLPIAGIAGDQQAALFGQGCGEPGMAKNTYGTGCFLLVQAGHRAPAPGEGLLATIAWQREGRTYYALEGSVFIAGAAVQWLRDELGLIATAEESEALARSVPDTAGVVIVPAFVGLGAPYWQPGARGTIVGLTRGAGRAHLARAVLESIAHQVTDVVEAMARSSGLTIRELRVDGGASANDFLMQFQADLLGVPLVRPRSLETTALGAAYLAGLGVGLWRPEDIAARQQPDRTFMPGALGAARAGRRAEWQRAVACARAWARDDGLAADRR
jgi:glycerol kinase